MTVRRYGDEWSGARAVDPLPNPLSVAYHGEIVRIMSERVDAEERWLDGILAARGVSLADAVTRCELRTSTTHLPTGLRFEAVLLLDGCACEPPFVWTLTYEAAP